MQTPYRHGQPRENHDQTKKERGNPGDAKQNSRIRGGTDGATFSFLGCPTPNLGTGSYNHHGRYEYLSLRDFKKMIDLVTAILILEPEK